MPIDLLSQFEAVVPPVTPGKNDAQLRQMANRHVQTCETLQVSEDALPSARRDLGTWCIRRSYTRMPLGVYRPGLMICKSKSQGW